MTSEKQLFIASEQQSKLDGIHRKFQEKHISVRTATTRQSTLNYGGAESQNRPVTEPDEWLRWQ